MKLPYFARDFLWPIEASESDCFVASIDYDIEDLPSNYLFGTFEMPKYMTLDCSDKECYERSQVAIEKLISALVEFREQFNAAYEANEAAKVDKE